MGPRLAFSKVRDREGAIANTRGTCAPRSNSLPLLAHRDGKGLRGLRTWLPLRMWTEKRGGGKYDFRRCDQNASYSRTSGACSPSLPPSSKFGVASKAGNVASRERSRSEEHTSELQSRQ